MGIINAECGKTFRIAYQGENKRQQVRFDLADIMGEFPGGTAVLAVLRNGDADPVPAAETEMDGTALIWTVTAWECALDGFLYAQVTYAAGETVAKTKVYRFDVKNSLVVNGAEPEDWQDLVGQLVTAADGVNSAISAAMDTLDEKVTAAEAAQDAAEDAQEAAETARDEAVAAVGQYDAMTATATGLAAGEEPTAVIDHTGDHPVLQLGIPKGEKGDTGATGQAGPAGPSGVDGFSPTAGVSKVGKIATITIVDKNGTTTASVSDGADGDPGDLIDDEAGAGDTDKTFSADKLTADHNSLLNQIDGLDAAKAPVIIDSASGAIATFPDGADSLPLESLIAEINPVQDLHGQSNPWPAGGGKNKWHLFANGYYSSSGVFVNSSVLGCSDKIPVTEGQSISFGGVSIGTETLSLRGYFFDSRGMVVGSILSGSNTATWTVPSGVSTVALWFSESGFDDTMTQDICDSLGIMMVVGTTLGNFAPYSNICPITGWTGCNVTRCGRNLLPKPVDGTYTGNGVTAVVKDGVITLSGTTTASGNAFTIPLTSVATVPPGAYIHLLNSVANASVAPSFELSTDVSGTSVAPACSPANRIYQTNKTNTVTWDRIRFYLGNGVAISGTLSPMLCLDDVVSDFVPFARYDTYPITWQTDAGTVYGGTVNPVTGKLIVTDAEIESYNGETLPSTWISDRDVYAEGTTPTIGAQVVYKLAEPLEYDLDSITVNTLLAYNAIFADTGDVAVDYRADTRLFVEKTEVSGVQDVKVNGTSVVTDGVANVPLANFSRVGAFKTTNYKGFTIDNEGNFAVQGGMFNVEFKPGDKSYVFVTTYGQHFATYYGLSKVAGVDLKNESVTPGTYPEASKSAISQMLDAPETISGTTPSITAKAGVRYVCGEVSTLTIVVPSSGCIDVTFTSGSTATVLTVTPPTGLTMKWANGFDPSSLDANTTYEINIMDGLGVAGSWT